MRSTDIYHTDAVWEQYGSTPDYRERAAAVLALIPPSVRSILDVGCGTGDVVRAITDARPGISSVGCDSSPSALARAPGRVVRAGLPELPFRDKSFDLLLCLEVLEHIAEASYAASLRELERLAGRYIIIGVPYRENLLTKQVLCGSCGRVSHADCHVRAYTRRELHRLLQGFAVKKTVLAGIRQQRQSGVGMRLRHRLGGLYYRPEFFSCRYCGNDRFVEKARTASAMAGRTAVLINAVLTAFNKALPYWIIGLYERQHR